MKTTPFKLCAAALFVVMACTTPRCCWALNKRRQKAPVAPPLWRETTANDNTDASTVSSRRLLSKKKKKWAPQVSVSSRFQKLSHAVHLPKRPHLHLPHIIRRRRNNNNNTTNKQKERKKTQLDELSNCFEAAYDETAQSLDTERLLQACHAYAVATRRTGQKAVARDFESNIKKVEALYKVAPPERRKSLESLLEFERETGIHRPGGILRDPSAAVGFLWIRRSLCFQSEMYETLLNNEDHHPKKCALDSYKTVLEPYHNWAYQKLYRSSFQTMTPPRKETLAGIGGFEMDHFGNEEEKATVDDLKRLLHVLKPILEQWQHTYETLDLEDKRRV